MDCSCNPYAFPPSLEVTKAGKINADAAIVLLTPSQIRGTVAAVYLFVLNMIAMGLGPLLTALMNDHVFHSDLAVGRSVAVVATTALVLSTILLAWGRPHFRDLSERSRAGARIT